MNKDNNCVSEITAILKIYVENALIQKGDSDEKVHAIHILFEYLLTNRVKPYLLKDNSNPLRKMILKKIDEFRNENYIKEKSQKFIRFIDAMDELELLLVPNSSPMLPFRSRSDRLKHAFIRQYNKKFIDSKCGCPKCLENASILKKYNETSNVLIEPPPPPSLKLEKNSFGTHDTKILRRSLRIQNKNINK